MEVTVKNLADAIRKNGYPQIRGTFYNRGYKGTVLGACALGQAALNLNVSAIDLAEHYDEYRIGLIKDSPKRNSCPDIYVLNDNDGLSLLDIADRIEKWAEAYYAMDDIVYDTHEYATRVGE